MKLLTLVCAMSIVIVAPIAAEAAPPSNDDRANAMPIGELPFYDLQDLATATSEPGEPGCGGGPMIGRPGMPPTVWYRYVPTVTAPVVARTARMFGAYGFTVFEETPSGPSSVVCGRSAADQNGAFDGDVNLAMFTARSGQAYAIQVVGPDPMLTSNPGTTSFRLEYAPQFDVTLDYVKVETVTPTGGLGAWNRLVSFRAGLVDHSRGGTVAWRAYSCPKGSVLGCTQSASGEFHLWAMSRGERGYLWRDVTCVGEVEIRIELETSYSIDPNPSDNIGSTMVQVLAPGPNAGICP